jgi:hypothetical protein
LIGIRKTIESKNKMKLLINTKEITVKCMTKFIKIELLNIPISFSEIYVENIDIKILNWRCYGNRTEYGYTLYYFKF